MAFQFSSTTALATAISSILVPITGSTTASPSASDTPALSSQRPAANVGTNEMKVWDAQKFVKLYPGTDPNAPPFVVHKDWVCHYSSVLNAAFNSNFLEGQTQEYRLHVDGIDKKCGAIVIRKLEEIRRNERKIAAYCIPYIYDNTPRGSPLRQYFIHQCIADLRPEALVLKNDKFPREMLAEAYDAMRSRLTPAVLMSFAPKNDMNAYNVPEE
ncbi:uncharacterized protein PAC_01026 [Phialocephala subalpina]|uniref:Uncharacterized protein n=1 Tax=Phialocephala subalpina TaxID=576137 RepID=A0A1L7WEF6_9HELO|nr:uncharacterized protein PAC_01026 [Phialocephala subalpina]